MIAVADEALVWRMLQVISSTQQHECTRQIVIMIVKSKSEKERVKQDSRLLSIPRKAESSVKETD